MTEQKITDDELEQEIRKGKTQRQIAFQYGYGYPSDTLSRRASKLGYKRNRTSKIRSDGGVNIYLNQGIIQEALEKSGEELFEKDGDQHLAYEVVRVSNDGAIVLKPHSKPWRKETNNDDSTKTTDKTEEEVTE